MPFSDEELKRVKEELPLVDTFGRWLTNGDKLRALLSRLEAGEKAIRTMDYVRPSWKDLHFGMTLDTEMEAWRKECGK